SRGGRGLMSRNGPLSSAATGSRSAAMGGLRVTAAICTRGRPQQLARALESLRRQRVPPSEVLVIDNAPVDDAGERVVARVCPAARYVVEPIAGLDFARNRALAEATGDVVAFLDDDAVASPGWVAAIQAAFERLPALGDRTGRVEQLAVETAGQRLFEANGGYSRGGQAHPSPPRCAVQTARLARASHRLGPQRRERGEPGRQARSRTAARRLRRSSGSRGRAPRRRRPRHDLADAPGGPRTRL